MAELDLTNVQSGYRIINTINDNNRKLEEFAAETVTTDGAHAMEAPLDMSGHKIINANPGTSASDVVTKGQLDTLANNLPQAVIEQIAAQAAALVLAGGGVPSSGYVNPPAPSTVTTSDVTATQVTITWTMSAVTWAEGYTITRNGQSLPVVRGGATLTYTDTTVSPNTTYTYAVAAYNDTYGYDSAFTTAATITTADNTTVVSPGTPTGLAGVSTVPNTVNLNWQYNSTAPVNGFYIIRDGTELPTPVTTGQNSFTDTNVPTGTHTYSVVAFNTGYGRGTASSVINVNAIGPAYVVPPNVTGLTLANTTSTSLTYSWTYSSTVHAGFLVETIGPDDFVYQSAVLPKTARSHTISPLTPSTAYRTTVYSLDTLGGLFADSYGDATTSAGTPIVSPLDIVNTILDLSATIGTTFQADVFTATGGVLPYTWSAVTGMPNGITFTDVGNTGVWGGSPASGTHGNSSVTVRVTDAVGDQQSVTVNLSIAPAAFVFAEPSGIATNLDISSGVLYDSGSWEASAGVAPYLINLSGTLPLGISPTITSTSISFGGTATATVSGTYPITVAVSDALGTIIYYSYDLQYQAAGVNQAPVRTAGSPTLFTVQEGTAAGTILDADTLFTDPDGDTMTYTISDFFGNLVGVPQILTAAELGLTFNGTTGVLTGTPAADSSDVGDWTFSITADDANSLPISLAFTGTLTPPAGVPYLNSADVALVASGGTETGYTYTWVSGSIPTWLSSNAGSGAVNSSTGKLVGPSGNVPASGTFGPYVFRVTDSGSNTATLSLTFAVQPVLANDFASRAQNTLYSTDFQKVYINGVEVPSREITETNATEDIDQVAGEAGTAGSLWGERTGGSCTGNVIWIDDPTGRQNKVAKFIRNPADTETSGAWVKGLDGTLSSSNYGTGYKKIFVQYVFWADRNLYGYADANRQSFTKLLYLGKQAEAGQVVIGVFNNGFYSFFVDGSPGLGSPSVTDPTGFAKTPQPTPFSNANLANYQPRPGINYPAASDTKLNWYKAAGFLKWSGTGLDGDLSGPLGADFPSKTAPYANTKYYDERSHIIGGEEQGWPAACVATGGAGHIHLNAWNVIQIGVEYNPLPKLSTLCLWSAKLGDAPVLRIGMVEKLGFGSTVSNAQFFQKAFWIGWQNSNSTANTERPEGFVLAGEVQTSLTRIPFPNGQLPPLPAGFVG